MHIRGHALISDLFANWSQEQSMVAALLEASVCLCIGIDRFVRDEAGEVIRSMCNIDMDAEVNIPMFSDSQLQCDTIGYIPVAGILHCGLDLAGHYRAVMKLQPGLIAATQPANWMISDDGQLPTPIWQIPPDTRKLLTVICWYAQTVSSYLYSLLLLLNMLRRIQIPNLKAMMSCSTYSEHSLEFLRKMMPAELIGPEYHLTSQVFFFQSASHRPHPLFTFFRQFHWGLLIPFKHGTNDNCFVARLA